MDIQHSDNHRFASFILDRDKNSELAIHARMVLEATPFRGTIQPLPTGLDCLEGLMRLRDDTIPVINVKKRLGLTKTDYTPEAKVAVVGMAGVRFGLLFDDIKDVLSVSDASIQPIHPALLSGESLITHLIKLDNGQRTLQLLDVDRLLGVDNTRPSVHPTDSTHGGDAQVHHFSRFVVFSIGRQHYGIPVEQAQEITFLTDVDQTFQNDFIAGALDLRGHAIPVIDAATLLQADENRIATTSDKRVLVLDADEFQYGLIVDYIHEIICIADDGIMRVPHGGLTSVKGIYPHPDGRNIMLLHVDALIGEQQSCMRSVARLKARVGSPRETTMAKTETRHLITAECYLVFSIGKNFAVQLNDVQEIIEPANLMDIPGANGVQGRVLNLRGRVVPVIGLRHFYGYETDGVPDNQKLIIVRHDDHVIALEVDQIITIHKQVQYQRTPSLNPRFRGKQDTLDRLIEYIDETGINEHVLVLNVEAIVNNHLCLSADTTETTDQGIPKEK